MPVLENNAIYPHTSHHNTTGDQDGTHHNSSIHSNRGRLMSNTMDTNQGIQLNEGRGMVPEQLTTSIES